MATTHWITQGKGGVGKSLVASLLAQDIQQRFEEHGMKGQAKELVPCFDTDPVNATLAGYTALNVTTVSVTDETGMEIDDRKFDGLIEQLVELPPNAHAIIDNGASSFLKLCNYIKTSGAFDLLRENGCDVLLHTVVTGGQAVVDTLNGMDALVANFAGNPIAVWRNSYFGPVEVNGVDLEQLQLWEDHMGHIEALVTIPCLSAATYGVDLRNLFSRRQTFAEAAADSSLNLMERHRLREFWKKMRAELAARLLLEVGHE